MFRNIPSHNIENVFRSKKVASFEKHSKTFENSFEEFLNKYYNKIRQFLYINLKLPPS